MSKKNENVNPEIAQAKGISDEVSEAISDAMIDSSDNYGIGDASTGLESSDNISSEGASPFPTKNTNSAKKNADEDLVDLHPTNPEVEDGAYFTLSINLKEFKIYFNKSNMVPAYVRDYYYSLNRDIAINNKKQNEFADKNPS